MSRQPVDTAALAVTLAEEERAYGSLLALSVREERPEDRRSTLT